MEDPSYYQTGPPVRSEVQHQEHIFHLYAHQQRGRTEHTIVPAKAGLPNHFGCTNVIDWDIRDGPDNNAMVVGRLQGLGIAARKSSESWYSSFTLVFTDERFSGSTISVQGPLGPPTTGDEGDWAVVGGTGEFIYAQGVCTYKRIQAWNGGTITELHIRVVCLTFFPKPPEPETEPQPEPEPVQKLGPWGGDGGATFELQDAELPRRLESLTIYADDFIRSIAFSYIDQAGQTQTFGPWGGDDGRYQHQTIQLGPSEIVKEVYGATGDYYGYTVVTSLTIVTNVYTYGPYGRQSSDDTPFHVAAPENSSIVGFYGGVGEVVDHIGVYVGPN